jgi:hypothetical protein
LSGSETPKQQYNYLAINTLHSDKYDFYNYLIIRFFMQNNHISNLQVINTLQKVKKDRGSQKKL